MQFFRFFSHKKWNGAKTTESSWEEVVLPFFKMLLGSISQPGVEGGVPLKQKITQLPLRFFLHVRISSKARLNLQSWQTVVAALAIHSGYLILCGTSSTLMSFFFHRYPFWSSDHNLPSSIKTVNSNDCRNHKYTGILIHTDHWVSLIRGPHTISREIIEIRSSEKTDPTLRPPFTNHFIKGQLFIVEKERVAKNISLQNDQRISILSLFPFSSDSRFTLNFM